MKNNSARPGVHKIVNGIHEDYVAIGKKYPDAKAKAGIKRVEAVLDRANEFTVAFLGSNSEATHRVVCALLSWEEPPRALTKKPLRYVALPNSAELPAGPISCEHLANLRANYVELTLTPPDADAPVSGPIVGEDEKTVTLKVEKTEKTGTLKKDYSNEVFNKKDMITQGKIVGKFVDSKGEKIVCSVAPESLDTDGALSLDADEIVLNVDGSEEVWDRFDIHGWQCAAMGKRRGPPSYKAVFTSDENGVVPPAENMPLARVVNAAKRANVASVDIELDNALLRDGRAILVMPSFDVFNADMWESVRHAEALFVVLDGRVRAEEETFLARIRRFTQNIFFVQDKIEDAEWKEVRRKNVRALAACLGESPEAINARYFPVSSARKVFADSREDWQEGLRLSRFPLLLQRFKSLDSRAADKDWNHRVLEQIRCEAVTLRLALLQDLEKSQWTNDLLETFRKDFSQKYDIIEEQTSSAIRQMFGAHGIHPPVIKFMEKLKSENRKAKQLQDNSAALLKNFIPSITEQLEQILGDHLEKIYALPYQFVNASPPPPSTAVATSLCPSLGDMAVKYSLDEASDKLYKENSQIVSDLSATPGFWGPALQSLVYPVILGSSIAAGVAAAGVAAAGEGVAAGAAASATAGAAAATAIAVTGAVVAVVLVGAAIYVNRRATEKQQKEKNLKELQSHATNLCNRMRDESLRKLVTMKKIYNQAIREKLNAYTDRSPELDARQLNADIQEIDTLLDNISKQLPGFK